MDSKTNGSALPTGSVAISHAPAKTAARGQPPIGRAEIERLAHLIAVELGQALKRLDKIERACGLDPTAPQIGTAAIAPVIKNFVEARLAPIEALVREHEDECMRYADTFRPGKTYKRGQTVSFRGGLWLALGCTDTRPGGGDWKLVVKSGAFGPRDDGTKKSDDEN